MAQWTRASFAGVACKAEFTMIQGINPGSGSIVFEDVNAHIPAKGTLIFTDGAGTVQLQNIYADKPRREYDAIGGHQLVATVYDRRLAWKWGYIAGHFNRKDADGVPRHEKTLRQLLDMIFGQLGEANYQIYDSIDTQYPEVNWEYENPASALQDLCDQYGLVVGYNTFNSQFVIAPYDAYYTFPIHPYTRIMEGISGGFKPTQVILVGNKRVVQQRFENLTPVGLEKDGSIVPIKELSYRPAGKRWGDELKNLFNNVVGPEERKLAEQCIYKWYSVNWHKTRYGKEHYLPFLGEIADKIKKDGDEQHDKPYVIGEDTVWDGLTLLKKADIRLEATQDNYTFDRELGIVKFNNYQYAVSGTKSGSDVEFVPRGIHLIAAFEMNTNTSLDYKTYRRPILGGTELPFVYKEPSMVSYWKVAADDKVIELNRQELDAYANSILDKLVRMFSGTNPLIVNYPAVLPIEIGGIFKQVTWRCGDEGAETELQKQIAVPRPLIKDYEEKLMQRRFSILWDIQRRQKDMRRKYPYD